MFVLKRNPIKVGDIFPTEKYGDVVVTSYNSYRSVDVKFLNTGYKANVEGKRLRKGDVIDFSARKGTHYGVGIYDFWEFTTEKRKSSDFKSIYSRWNNLMKRCYCKNFLQNRPTYKEVTVCEEWHTFSSFFYWMVDKNWKGNHLDKDLLAKGSKVYQKDTCVFIHPKVNTFLSYVRESEQLTGVYYRKSSGKYLASVSNPFNGKQEFLGSYVEEDQAHKAWKIRKQEIAVLLANSEYVWEDTVKEELITLFS